MRIHFITPRETLGIDVTIYAWFYLPNQRLYCNANITIDIYRKLARYLHYNLVLDLNKENHPMDKKSEQLLIDQVKRLSGQTTIGIMATVINSSMMYLILRGVVPTSRLLLWIFLALALSLFRIILQNYYKKGGITPGNIIRYRNYLLFTLTLAGCIWGSAGILLLPGVSMPYQVFIAFILGGMVAGSVGVFASVMPAFYCFSIPTMLPMTVYFFSMDSDIHFAMGFLIIVFLFIMVMTAKRLNREIIEFLNLKYINLDLIYDLENEIRERRLVEEKLIARNQEIESIVLKRTSELRDVNEKLITEIKERKEADKALKESEEKYRELANSLPQIVFETDIKGKITFSNRNTAELFGYSGKDIEAGMHINTILPSLKNDKSPQINQKILEGNTLDGVECIAKRKDGSTFPVSVHSNPVKKENMVIGIRGIIIDLSHQKKAEEEQKKLESRLQRAQKMEALGTLAGGVAHDLNNILSGIVGYPDLILMQLPEDSPLRKPILTMQGSGNKAAAIVQDLLTLTRRGVLVEEIVNLNDIVTQYLYSPEYKKMMSFHDYVRVETELDNELLNITGSPVHLMKTVMNIVTNAVEAISKEGRVLISTKNIYLDSPLKGYDEVDKGDYAVLSISDNGSGISAPDLERIFEPFFTKKVMGKSGTGLGMTVVWGTVKDHKGYIDVKSTEGEGSTFVLYFPITRSGKKRVEVPEEELTLMSGKESVLIVDDVKEQREIAEAMLSQIGYSVTTVSSGEEAIEYLKNNSADLLILDMIMDPGMDGLETYKKILEINPDQKAIIASGYSETERVRETQILGAGIYLKKPYTYKALGRAVRAELDRI